MTLDSDWEMKDNVAAIREIRDLIIAGPWSQVLICCDIYLTLGGSRPDDTKICSFTGHPAVHIHQSLRPSTSHDIHSLIAVVASGCMLPAG
ncbi:hypothetical protein SERLA73DRAFT_138920 [Serpula lacrymans var. lacrymans S7.3]|uniref:Uncharacterized protein n=2 Tax=Serpula lacrymans var. lacrymans TaxID=341189 RepID=F8PZY7_SERL3|nr:uncharacterized protein SERLADRAFT_392844 [Serpula lacrymans var. lacrymans S7.9]EGN98459.1 hypothetical protein SERLA73DRAFT_138920 [Serpula lacrymans var. lacrymans S7.3]EGO24038.1 hypothetical protein SERLADRAFT_392844 [Serpula lacrymans var. lacrymans S7.9]